VIENAGSIALSAARSRGRIPGEMFHRALHFVFARAFKHGMFVRRIAQLCMFGKSVA
jgi:hypothetical protein